MGLFDFLDQNGSHGKVCFILISDGTEGRISYDISRWHRGRMYGPKAQEVEMYPRSTQ